MRRIAVRGCIAGLVVLGFATAPSALADPVPTLGVAHPYEDAENFGTARPDWYSTGSTAASTVTDITWDSWGGPQAAGHGLVSNGAGHPKLHVNVVADDLAVCNGQLAYRTVTSTALDDPGSQPFTKNICDGRG